MSVTTTTDSARYQIHSHLVDYELHHSGTSGPAPPPEAHPVPSTVDQQGLNARNPESWPTDHRRIPPYRPINRELDMSQRRVYTSVPERIFIEVMFTGVATNASVSQIWAATGGKLVPSWFRYKIGGEW
ncbi:hypothetical protein W97_07127 [Coniosporium apollinis CBS 100218]|uniref:Uncharacterized protein n=1 Tax=Coniosporium apollinis (strain CBS 100218) TaxID=1168221 RepID=R7Z226_CONA1|nr:uncharacterized protein W97_07127 [Coniosporium apollinis CBS 100218]EON67981.1 hypothetical protein W97_07127 [Coniosporium apollinis CBS 100218]